MQPRAGGIRCRRTRERAVGHGARDMTPYGQAWLLLDAAAQQGRASRRAGRHPRHARADEGRPGLVALRERPAARRLGRRDRRRDGGRGAGARGGAPDRSADRSGCPVAARQPAERHDLGQHQADGDGAVRTARRDAGPAGTACGRRRSPCRAAASRRALRSRPQDWTRPFPALVTLPAAAGNNAVTITTAGGPAYWTASARYYDTAAGLERTGTRKLALSRKYFTLAPVRRDGRVVYDERPYTGTASPGDLILVRLVVAGLERLALPDDRGPDSRRHRGRDATGPARTGKAPQLDVRVAPRVPRRPRGALPRSPAWPRRVRVPAAGDDAGPVPGHARAGHADVRAGRQRLERGADTRRVEPAGAAR